MQYLLTKEEYATKFPDRAEIEKEIRTEYNRIMAGCLARFAVKIMSHPELFCEWTLREARWNALLRFAQESNFPEPLPKKFPVEFVK